MQCSNCPSYALNEHPQSGLCDVCFYKIKLEDAYREAKSLAEMLHKKYFTEKAPQWEVLPYPDVAGVLTQIDNQTMGIQSIYEEAIRYMEQANWRSVSECITMAKK